jgi:geranylgeranyl reductase family protein
VTDVIIVGGGPAGTSTAIALARRGVRVRILDKARFPRSKPCAEYLSPQVSRILDDLGVLERIEATGAAQLAGVVVRAPSGEVIHGEFVAGHGFTPYRNRGLSVRREVLDAILLDAARDAGVEVREGARVSDLVFDERRASGVIVGKEKVRSEVVIGADGLRSVVARRLKLAASSRWPRRLALVSHYENVEGIGELAEMHVTGEGFVGIADVGNGATTVALVVPATRAGEIAGNKEGFLDAWLGRQSQLARRFKDARRISPVQATGPFASRSRRAWAPGSLLVGDAADFFDPFTGEGIYAAMRGGELAAEAAHRALGCGEKEQGLAFRAYDAARKREFSGKWIVEKVVAATVARPWLINRAAFALSRRRDLADLLIGVTGDFVPAREVVNLRYVLAAFGFGSAANARAPVVDSALPG